MRKKILIFQHVPYEILGALHPLLKKSAFGIRYVNFGRKEHPKVNMDRYDGLVVLGGPMSVYETKKYPHLLEEIQVIQDAVNQQKPVLGICLGAQLIAAALGAEVKPNAEKEIGWYDVSLTKHGQEDPLLKHFKETEKIFQWHGDAFEIPKGGVKLASSKRCGNQAFRYRKNVYAFQFHLEVDRPMIKRWLRVPVHRAEIEELKGKIDPSQINLDTEKFIVRSKEMSQKIFSEFIRLFGAKKRRILLGSGHR